MRRGMWICIAVVVIAAQGFAQTAADSAKGAKETIKAIWEAANVYHQDKGKWPKDLKALTDSGHYQDRTFPPYLTIPADVRTEWEFGLDYKGAPNMIRAESMTIKVKGEGDDYPPARIDYETAKGAWSGYGVPRYERDTLTTEQRAELAADAKNAMLAIYEAARVFYQDKGYWPESVAILDEEHYIGTALKDSELIVLTNPSAFVQWQFAIIGAPPQSIIAVSTKDMPGGVGKGIVYDAGTKEWRGYGVK